MSEAQHTKGPLRFVDETYAETLDGKMVANPKHDMCPEQTVYEYDADEACENIRRLVACWNACEGISTEALEGGVVKELLEACEQARSDENICRKCFDLLGDAIKKAKGQS